MATDTTTDIGIGIIGAAGVPWVPAGPARGEEVGRAWPARTGDRIARLLEDAVLLAGAGAVALGLLLMSFGMALLMEGR